MAYEPLQIGEIFVRARAYDDAPTPPKADRIMGWPYSLTTARLGFRHWSADDLPLALVLWGNPEVTRLIGGPFSHDAVVDKLHAEIRSMERHGVQYWPIFLLQDGAHVGCAGLRQRGQAGAIYELGFHLRRLYWGQGLAVEAARAVVTLAFDTLGARALFAGHHPDNVASRAVLEKLGFRHTHNEWYPATGAQHPSYLLSAGAA